MKRTLAVVLTLAAAVTAVRAAGDDACVMHLSFDAKDDEVTLDSSGRGNYGTLIGPTWSAEGVRGGCYRFDGKDDAIDCGNAAALNPGTGDFSVSLWFKTGRKGVHQPIVHSGGRPTGGGAFYLNLTADNVLEAACRFRTADGKTGYANRDSCPRPRDVNDGRWHHAAMVVRGGSSGGPPRLFVDGAEDTGGASATRNAKAMVLRNDDPLFLGAGGSWMR